jgi:hypothetical protein
MQKQIELQELINSGKKRESEIEKAIYDAKKKNAGLTQEQEQKIRDMSGALFDITEKEEKKSGILSASQAGSDVTNQMLRVGAFMGTDFRDTGAARVQQKQLNILEKIEKNTAKKLDIELGME